MISVVNTIQIQRAMAITRMKTVKNNEDDKFWTVKDENDDIIVVKLFPVPSCSCKITGKSKCAHLLAAMKAYGQPITDG